MNGEIVEKPSARVNVYDHGLLYGDGVFEGIRIYNGRIFQAEAHLDRLFESARRIRLAIPYTKQELLEAMQQTLAADTGRSDGYVRLVVTRGMGSLGLNPFLCVEPTVFAIVDDIQLYPEQMYRDGMTVIIARTVRCSARMLDPQVKSLNYLNNILAKIEAIDAGVPEALMLNEDGEVAEATGDNIFIVRDGRLLTPAPEAGILHGVTRGVVMHLARREGIEVEQCRLLPEDVYAAEECLLSGTAAEVIAVTSVDSTTVGDGKVGPVTRRLMDAFKGFILSGEQIRYP
jgi:branched-chain amino acid aminotransferase